jgi:hypothetical protein
LTIRSNGEAALTGTKEDFTASLKEVIPREFFSAFLEVQKKVAGELQPSLNEVMQDAVSIVNSVKARAVNRNVV